MIEARKIDMRASPYDVSHIEGCEIPICVETTEGKLLYAKEQMKLYQISMPLRHKLFEVYSDFIEMCKLRTNDCKDDSDVTVF